MKKTAIVVTIITAISISIVGLAIWIFGCYKSTKPIHEAPMTLCTCAVDDTKIIYDRIDTKYFVYLWDDVNMQCMQYSVPDAATFAALEEMIGYGIEIKNYGKECCFWEDTCLSNGKLIPNYFSKSKTKTST